MVSTMVDVSSNITDHISIPARLADAASALAREERKPLLARKRFQLGSTIFVGVLVPLLVRWPANTVSLEVIHDPWHLNTATAAALAIALGFMIVRQFLAYPGAKATSYILPGFAVSFGIVSLVFLLGRVDYSRYILVTSFVLSILWLHLVYFLNYRHALPKLALVPGGDDRGVTQMHDGARWVFLDTPAKSLTGIEAVVADLRAEHRPDWERFIAQCVLAGIPVYDVRNVHESLTGRVEVRHLSENSFGSVLPSNLYMQIKRLLDLLMSTIFLLPVCLLIGVMAVFIKLESKGPAFFVQPRMGYRGRTFRMFKLRSMRTDMPPGQYFTSEDDPRITRIGRFIRKYRIDELPQIFNIIRGDMSWIGPRPEAVQLGEWYAKDIPFYVYRHAVRPGISGWAQVNQGNVAEVEAATVKLQFDFYYIKNFSPWLDLLIVLKTIRTVLTGFGSV